MGNPNHFISIDPGETSTGWATFSSEGRLTGLGVITGGVRGLARFLAGEDPTKPDINLVAWRPRVFIVETYRIKDYQFKHNMSTVPTIRVIGHAEGICELWDAEWYEQESTVYPTGLKWAGHKVPTGHVPDQMSALGHGVYHLHKRKPSLWEIKL